MTPSSPERLLAGLVTEVAEGDIGPGARRAAERQALDCTGVTLAASAQPAGAALDGIARELGPGSGARVLGTGTPTSVVHASFTNGSLAHLLDFDDRGFSHPTACLLPVTLAVGEHVDASGRDAVTALVLGYEVFERLAASGRPNEPHLRSRGYHPTSIYGAPAAAAVAGRLLGLSEDQLVVAFGIAASGATGLSQQFGTWAKGVNAGNAARVGVTAALLARAGYHGDDEGLSGRYGLFSAVHGEGAYDFADVATDLGTRWSIEDPGLAIKPYPACTSNLRAVDAMAMIAAMPGYTADDVVEVRVDVHPDVFHTLRYRSPVEGFRGKFSLDFTVAAMALDGDLRIESFSDEAASRPAFRAMLDRVVLAEHPDWPMSRRRHMPVTATMRDGSVHTETVEHHRGSPEWPLDAAEVDAKFVTCAETAMPTESARRALHAMHTIDEAPAVRGLVDALVAPSAQAAADGPARAPQAAPA